MSESVMRGNVVRMLKPLDAIAVENPIRPGTPDVNYAEGWVELKYLEKWPKNADKKPVLISIFSQQQRRWLTRRSLAKGNVFLLLQVGREWLLFEGSVAAANLGLVTRKTLRAIALARWERGIDEEALRSWLTSSFNQRMHNVLLYKEGVEEKHKLKLQSDTM